MGGCWCWQRSTLTRSRLRTTIDAGGLYCRVRDGTGCIPTALATNSFVVLLMDIVCDRVADGNACNPHDLGMGSHTKN